MEGGQRLLAIECATEACSVALIEHGALLAGEHALIGRGHAERLVPMIAALPDRGRAARIIVSLGPGSFTGVRIGLAAAQALGLAWGAAVEGYPTLALVAAMARERRPGAVTVCMAGGHGEWFVQDFDGAGAAAGPVLSLPPEEAARRGHAGIVAGNRAGALAQASGQPAEVLDILPDARAFARLGTAIARPGLTPIYGRNPDARLPEAAR